MASKLTRLMRVIPLALAWTAGLTAQDSRPDHFGAGQSRLRALCAAYNNPDFIALERRERDMTKAIADGHVAGTDWHTLGCVRALLYAHDLDFEVRHGEWPVGALDAFAQALETLPADSLAAEGLAVLAFDLTNQLQWLPTVARRLRPIANAEYSAVVAGVHDPIVLRACTEFNIDNGDVATARYCDAFALSLNIDVSWHMIRESWFASLHDDSVGAAEYFDDAVLAARTADAVGEVSWHVRWIADSGWMAPGWLETQWMGLSDSGRVAWVHNHLAQQLQIPLPPTSRRIPRGAPTRTAPPSSYPAILTQAEAAPRFISPMLEFCPIALERNGARAGPDNPGCVVTLDYAGRSPGNVSLPLSPIRVTSQLNLLWDPRSATPLGLLTYAITGVDFSSTENANGHAAIDLDVRQWEWRTGRWMDSVIEIEFSRSAESAKGARQVGALLIHPPDGPSSWTLRVTQGARTGNITVDGKPGLDTAPVMLSDLVIGAESQGLTWPVGNRSVTLAPWNTVKAHEPLHLYYQIRSDAIHLGAQSRVSLRHIVNGRIEEKAALSLTFGTTVSLGIGEVDREVDLSRLASSGDYQLTVEVLGADGEVLAHRATNLYLR